MNRKFIFLALICLVSLSAYAQRTETVSKAYHIKIENRRELLKKLQEDNQKRQILWQKELDKKKQELPQAQTVSDNVKVEVKPTVLLQLAEDGSQDMSLNVSFSYETKASAADTASGNANKKVVLKISNRQTDDYPAGAYNASTSNACKLTCDFMKNKIENELAKYFVKGNKVTIKIIGETDGSPVKSKLEYKGEYGDFNDKMIYLNGVLDNVTVTRETGITSNAQLAFLRTQGVESFLRTYVDALQQTENTYQIYAVENTQRGKEYRRISIEITVHGAFNEEMNNLPEAVPSLDIEKITSDVDVNIPESGTVNSDAFALIIANEKYNDLISDVPFAGNDGSIFKEYCIKTLGIPERQIKLVENATLNGFNDGVEWLTGVTKSWNGDARVIVYYAGHGVPNVETDAAYLVPVDANPSKPKQLFGLNALYSALGNMPASSVTVFLDACFSGTKRNGEMLVADGRGVAIKVKKETLKGNMVVFSAADAYQTAFPLREKKHGLFTYYLLKKIQESQGMIAYGDLFDGIKSSVTREASLNSREQTPTVSTPSSLQQEWRFYKFFK